MAPSNASSSDTTAFSHSLQTFLEVAAITGSRQQGSHVEGKDRRMAQHFRHFGFDDAPRQPLGNGGLSHPGVAHIERVVLRTPTEDLDGALDLQFATDQGIDFSLHRLAVQVDAIGAQRLLTFLDHVLCLGVLVRAVDRARLAATGCLGDAVRNVIDRVQPGHVLQLKEIDGVAFAFREQGDDHVRSRHFLAARGLDVNGCPLHDPLKPGRRFGVTHPRGHQIGKSAIDKIGEIPTQAVKIHVAGA
jgi:hypothetical protein